MSFQWKWSDFLCDELRDLNILMLFIHPTMVNLKISNKISYYVNWWQPQNSLGGTKRYDNNKQQNMSNNNNSIKSVSYLHHFKYLFFLMTTSILYMRLKLWVCVPANVGLLKFLDNVCPFNCHLNSNVEYYHKDAKVAAKRTNANHFLTTVCIFVLRFVFFFFLLFCSLNLSWKPTECVDFWTIVIALTKKWFPLGTRSVNKIPNASLSIFSSFGSLSFSLFAFQYLFLAQSSSLNLCDRVFVTFF